MTIKCNARTIILTTIIAATIYGCGKDPETTPTPVDPNDTTDTTTWQGPIINPAKYNRDSAVKDYNEMYLGSKVVFTTWTGNVGSCDPGTVPQSVHDAVIKRINYFRKITGLNYDCVMDASLFPAQQQTALMMTANFDLSHNPPATWSCYTQDGADGAAKSNLRLGSAATDAVTAFMEDSEDYNEAVGHRRWLLYSKQSAFSHGSTENAAVIHVVVKAENTHIPEFIAYPPATYVPSAVVFTRWSFSIPNADFSAATVTMTHDGNNVGVKVVSKDFKVADNTIVWEPQIPVPSPTTDDLTYKVTVSGIGGADKSSYTYEVIVIKP